MFFTACAIPEFVVWKGLCMYSWFSPIFSIVGDLILALANTVLSSWGNFSLVYLTRPVLETALNNLRGDWMTTCNKYSLVSYRRALRLLIFWKFSTKDILIPAPLLINSANELQAKQEFHYKNLWDWEFQVKSVKLLHYVFNVLLSLHVSHRGSHFNNFPKIFLPGDSYSSPPSVSIILRFFQPLLLFQPPPSIRDHRVG